MAKAIFVVPFAGGSPQFPGIDATQVSYVCASYVPPPAGTAQYALVWIETSAANIATLTARADCLFIANRLDDGSIETATITATQRNAVRTKIANMGFTGAQYGLLVAAINSSQNRDDLAVNIATKAFMRDVAKNFMTLRDVRGTMKGQG